MSDRNLRSVAFNGRHWLNFTSAKKGEIQSGIGTISFAEAAYAFIEENKFMQERPKLIQQWQSSLGSYVIPIMGQHAVEQIDTQLVLKCLVPIWESKTATAIRIRCRIERILNWCFLRDYRSGDNPARWKDHLEDFLPAPKTIRKVVSFGSLPHIEMGEFFQKLHDRDGLAARMLEFTILTAARSDKVRVAKWADIDMERGTWTVLSDLTGRPRANCIPLSPCAIELLRRVRENTGNKINSIYVFPGPTGGMPLSNKAMRSLLKQMGLADITVHGFRQTFCCWAAEHTESPREVLELAIGRRVSSPESTKFGRVCHRVAERTQLMVAWGKYCSSLCK